MYFQVTQEYYVPTHSMRMFVLECDDSQINILDDNDWKKSPPPAPWTESLSCTGTGDTTVYRGTKRNTHFKNMLPGTVTMCHV